MRNPLSAAVLAGIVALSGCASIVSDSKYPVSIQSDTPDTTVIIKNRRGQQVHTGVAPLQVTLHAGNGFFSKAKYSIDFEKEGYVSSRQPFDATLDGWYFGNIIFGGLIGILFVDPATGAMWKLPESTTGNLVMTPEYQAQLQAEAEAAIAREQAQLQQPAERTAAERLLEIKALHEQGALTDAEYEEKKAALLQEI